MNMFGYETFTTFWEDFSIADAFGTDAIEDTYNRAFKEWKNNYEYLTELVMILNWKLWEHYEKGNTNYARLYDRLWRESSCYACENLKDKELEYYYRTTD